MKSFLLIAVSSFLFIAPSAQAIVGGPFDNGGQSVSLTKGIYQAVLSFKNGNGFCYFNPDQRLVSENLTNILDYDGRGDIQNRAVIYYKGITYVGSALGFADTEDRYVQCSINGGSELGFSVSQTTSTGAGAGLNQASSSVSDVVVSSNRGFIVNGNWEAKIDRTAPTSRFSGKGELLFLAPTGADSVAGLAYSGYAGLIGAIVNAVSNLGGTFNPAIFTQAQLAIDNALLALPGHLAGAGLDSPLTSGDTVKVKVRGSIRYQ